MRRREFWLLIGPSLVIMVGLLVVPLYRTIQWSFQEVNYGTPGTFVGLDNYVQGLSEPRFRSAVIFTVGLTLTAAVIIVVLGYVLAYLIDRAGKMRPVVLGIMLISYVIPHVVGANAFSWLFDSNFGGPVNLVVERLIGHEVLWFTDEWPNRILLLANVVWSMLPFAMLMILAGAGAHHRHAGGVRPVALPRLPLGAPPRGRAHLPGAPPVVRRAADG